MIIPVDSSHNCIVEPDCINATKAFFSENTPLKRASEFGGRSFERRIQQETMAESVAEALEKKKNLCVEAPTGVGKSFAYLVPAIYYAKKSKMPVLITTETITLQEQLFNKDLPLLAKLTGTDFTYVLAKGRSNYICRRRLSLLVDDYSQELLPDKRLREELKHLTAWVNQTKTGSRSEISFKLSGSLWNCVCCETTSCRGPKCLHYHNCFYWKNRKNWDKADIIVTNHALFFTDLKIRKIEMQENCPLPNYSAVIFDEAHTLEDNAANHLGIHVSSTGVRFLLNRLFNPANSNGLLMKQGTNATGLRAKITTAHDGMAIFFSQYEREMAKQREDCLKITGQNGYEDNFSGILSDLERDLKDYVDNLDSQDFKMEVQLQLDRCAGYKEEIENFTKMKFDKHVYWVEGRGTSSSGLTREVELTSAPLNVAEILQKLLFDGKKTIILTSATLAVNNSLSYYASRVGFCGGEGLILDSPFDYEKQVKLFVTRKMPLPNDRDYNTAAAEQIRRFVEKTNGHAFVLFTSYSMLKDCAERLSTYFLGKGIDLLAHGEDLSRTAMLEQFRKGGNKVIFGASSFWTGVDIPGDALSNVIITKLPFAVPNHPLNEARCRMIEEAGGNPFRDYSIPEAVLKFRQGIGRLIRSRSDKGILVVLDPRIATKSYGKNFLFSIPKCPIEYF